MTSNISLSPWQYDDTVYWLVADTLVCKHNAGGSNYDQSCYGSFLKVELSLKVNWGLTFVELFAKM